ncbi:SanA/YdcF family protein [Eremococcus coleocola]|uniref:DUF218 domain-containing protein n=1 Tax=Eremococcus coleocola ACS-139-V-Col8 TaxID=908337 RepID=E4KN02_9LACT|nr:ElyC/SanA/YdcF family protein [Eremococcus coleocola]EFR31599.1 hypothetical protein HMPREF9257_0215 [Eremococcus coleocola ACS-139-V-Col8]
MDALFKFIQILAKGSAYLILAFLALVIMINLAMIAYGYSRTVVIDQLQSKGYGDQVPVVVLGAGVINNEEPSQILKLRLDKAYQVFEEAPDRKFIMSGDHLQDNYNEVAVMKNYLIDKGIPANQIYLDHVGTSTYNTIYRLKHVLKIDKAIFITQNYHLSRTLYIAKQLGVQALGVAAQETYSTRFQRESREILARIKDVLSTHFNYQNKHTLLDYSFDLNESGNQTDDKQSLEKD